MKRVFAALGLSLSLLASSVCVAAEKFNVLFIAVDDLRPQLGCYGDPVVKSPNIDGLAKQSLQFDRAYCQLALCNPSRSSLLSGRRPETLGIYDLKTNVRDKWPDVVTLPELFKKNGYTSLSFGKIFHAGNGNHDDLPSFSERPWHPGNGAAGVSKGEKTDVDSEDPHADQLPYAAPDCADEELPDGQVAKAAIEAMRKHKDEPLFLAVGFYRPHLPFVAPKRYWDQYDPADIKSAPNPMLPKDAPAFASNDASELRRYSGVPKKGPISDSAARPLIHGYDACVSYVDAQVGKVLRELDRLGLREKTVVILWGDHGYQLGEHGTWNKRTDWEIATRVPMLVSFPGQATRGQTSDALVEFVDVYPTLAELCGLTPPAKLEGMSFVPVLNAPDAKWKSAAFSIYEKKVPELGGTAYGRAMVTERYRLIEWSGAKSEKRVYELYDHQSDPQENTNVANLPENRQLVDSLARQLAAGWKAAGPKAE